MSIIQGEVVGVARITRQETIGITVTRILRARMVTKIRVVLEKGMRGHTSSKQRRPGIRLAGRHIGVVVSEHRQLDFRLKRHDRRGDGRGERGGLRHDFLGGWGYHGNTILSCWVPCMLRMVLIKRLRA